MLLVFLVVFVFLQDWRATLIPAVTIPVSLIGTFAVLYAIGFGINTITLFALVLAIGLVVDDAIVVVENVARLLGEGVPRREAVLRSMGEVTSAIVAASLVLGAVFVPVALLPGTTGQMLRHFGLAVTCAVLISLLNALTLSPALCALLMRPEREHKPAFFRGFDRGFARLVAPLRPRRARAAAAAGARARGLRRALRRRTSCSSAPCRPASCPDEDQGYFITSFQLPDGASLERTDAVAREVEKHPDGYAGRGRHEPLRRLRRADRHLPAELRLGLRDARALGRAHREGAVDRRDLRLGAAAARRRFRARAPSRSTRRRSAVSRASAASSSSSRIARGGSIGELAAVTQRIVDEGERSPELQNLFTSFRPTVPADRGRPRPRQGQDARRARRRGLRDAPGLHGRSLHQRLRPLRAPVPRLRAGRGRPALEARGRAAALGALGARRDGAALDAALARGASPARATSRTTTCTARRRSRARRRRATAPGRRSTAWRRSRAR